MEKYFANPIAKRKSDVYYGYIGWGDNLATTTTKEATMSNIATVIYIIGYIITTLYYWADMGPIDSFADIMIGLAGSQMAAMIWPVYGLIELLMA